MKHTLLLLALMLTTMLSGCKEPLGKNGYEGIWQRGNDRIQSTIEIYKDAGDHWWFRWLRESDNKRAEIRCEWGQPCEEFVDGERTSTYEFSAWIDEETGYLIVHQKVYVWKPGELKMEVEDELILEADGLALWSYTTRRGDDSFEGDARPKRRLVKISDQVSNPPPVR